MKIRKYLPVVIVLGAVGAVAWYFYRKSRAATSPIPAPGSGPARAIVRRPPGGATSMHPGL